MQHSNGHGNSNGPTNANGNTSGEIENLTMTGPSRDETAWPSINEIRMGAKLYLQLDIQIKHEPPSTSDLTSAPVYPLPSPSHKRTRSNTQESAGKRQRIETEAPSGLMPSDAFADILRGVSASITQQFQQREPSQLGIQDGYREDAVHTRGFTSDPYFSMRILSLPVLDSLVRAIFIIRSISWLYMSSLSLHALC
jgi:hypothetical protein